jgi:surfactin synthase thioesterase subunit
MSEITLFAIPFAGGSKYSYTVFSKYLPSTIELKAIELPGRGERIAENLVDDIHLLADDVFNQIKASLNKPYIIYGHSMGTLLAYLVMKKITDNGITPPLQVVVSGAAGPSSEERERGRHLLSKSDFKKKLEQYGGSPKEVLENEELFDFFEPILRNDFKVVETYHYTPWDKKMEVPITVLIGLEERVSMAEAKLWENETNKNVTVKQFPGGHFFIYEYPAEVVKTIIKTV